MTRNGGMIGFDPEEFKAACHQSRIRWQNHADVRRRERGIAMQSVIRALLDFDLVESYPDSFPLPSVLIFGNNSGRPIYVVAAYNQSLGIVSVVTLYFPDEERFQPPDFRKRKKR